MKRWLGLFAVLAVAAVAVLGYLRWQSRPSISEERFMQIRRGMTDIEVIEFMGRRVDHYDWAAGQYEFVWRERGESFVVVFNGFSDRVIGKAISSAAGVKQA
jgi:hypothetical protein